jgi:hypothetical protein
MSDNAVFLKRLQRTLAKAGSANDCAEQVIALFDDYRGQLYRQLDIDSATQPTTTTKMVADCTLNDLRQRILKAEIETAEPWRAVLTAVRGRVDMARRALATHIAKDDVAAAPLTGAYEWPGCPPRISLALSARAFERIFHAPVIHPATPDVARRGGQRAAEEDPRCPMPSPILPS